MPITAIYASLLAFLFLLLSVRVIVQRREARVEIGHGESRELLRRSRVHANFAEYVPVALILLALAESMKVPSVVLHALGLMLVAGRTVHAYALSRNPHILRLRVLGMWMTLATIGLLGLVDFAYGVIGIAV